MYFFIVIGKRFPVLEKGCTRDAGDGELESPGPRDRPDIMLDSCAMVDERSRGCRSKTKMGLERQSRHKQRQVRSLISGTVPEARGI